MKVKLKVVVVVRYEANSEHYGSTDPEKMAAIDQKNFEDHPEFMFAMGNDPEIHVVQDATRVVIEEG